MKYAIGARVLENDGKVSDGLYGYGQYGLSCLIVSEDIKPNQYRIPVFSGLKEAERCVKHLSHIHRDEFHGRAQRHKLDISQFRFFLVKVDSSNFKRKLGSVVNSKQGDYKSRKVYWIE